MRISVLSSSRADFGIYLPLLREMRNHPDIQVDLIVFGTHLSYFHGNTVADIIASGFEPFICIDTLMTGDSPNSLSSSTGLTIIKFGEFWQQHRAIYDFVICLGDRYEMFGAVTAGIPFNLKFAHIHAGEETSGAIDNVYRHCISHASSLFFTSTEENSSRVIQLTNRADMVFNVGALSLDSLKDFEPFTTFEFQEKWGIDLNEKFILFTFHPETVNFLKNEDFCNEIIKALKKLSSVNVLITMPNADTAGNTVRKLLTDNLQKLPNFYLVESLGSKGYFTALNRCQFVLGNSSSGILEAASFHKYVINLGDRQKGRTTGNNVIHSQISESEISEKIKFVENLPAYAGENVYWNGGAAKRILQVLKTQYEKL